LRCDDGSRTDNEQLERTKLERAESHRQGSKATKMHEGGIAGGRKSRRREAGLVEVGLVGLVVKTTVRVRVSVRAPLADGRRDGDGVSRWLLLLLQTARFVLAAAAGCVRLAALSPPQTPEAGVRGANGGRLWSWAVELLELLNAQVVGALSQQVSGCPTVPTVSYTEVKVLAHARGTVGVMFRFTCQVWLNDRAITISFRFPIRLHGKVFFAFTMVDQWPSQIVG
jgi:hypothetical protein